MAVYTSVSDSELRIFLIQYDIGNLISFRGIEQGIDNSNYKLKTSKGTFILTLFENRMIKEELPFFLNLLNYLSQIGVSCPKPLVSFDGKLLKSLCGRKAAILTFLKGSSIEVISPDHCSQVGSALAKLHLASKRFSGFRSNDLSLKNWFSIKESLSGKIDQFETGLEMELVEELSYLKKNWPLSLPKGVIHADLFPDNVFFQKGQLTGIIDFYFACCDTYSYDISICLNAWCFDSKNKFVRQNSESFLKHYQMVRELSIEELESLSVMARGSALRFTLTRLYDWFNRPKEAIVKLKDPVEYIEKLRFHKEISSSKQYGVGA